MKNIDPSREILKEIEKINQGGQDRFIKYNEIIAICTNSLSKLRSTLASHEFSDKQEEIDFFKKIKPIPLSNLIYYSEIKLLEMNFPRINPKDQRKYILKQSVRLNTFFAEQSEFVQYINLGHDHRDKYYFTREHSLDPVDWDTHFHFRDPMFNTSHDSLYAKVLAFQRLVPYLENRLEKLENNVTPIRSTLKWTSSKISLTELIYALHLSTSINNGQAGIAQIANLFEHVFHIDLGDYYHIYTEIKARKKSRVKFLDELSGSLMGHLDDQDR